VLSRHESVLTQNVVSRFLNELVCNYARISVYSLTATTQESEPGRGQTFEDCVDRAETYAEHIRVEFSVGSITTVDFEGKPAFAAPLPPSLLRFQRRETYRVHVPRSRPIVCELPPTGDGGQPVLANVRDISIGGIALVDFPPGFRLVQGTVFERCVLTLTRTEKIAVGLELVHVYRAPHAAPGRGQLVGCRFLHLDSAAEARIQRLINQLDRERLAPG